MRAVILPALTVMGALGASILGAAPASAYCGAQCREAKAYCNSWENSHPGEECGIVRGYSCTGSSWKRIKIVNGSWSACRLVKGADDLQAAENRCDKYEKVEGGLCQVHSPLCNAGWRSIGDYGKFRACRPLEAPSGSLAYDGYKAFFSGVEGEADTAIPEHLHPFLKKHYSIDLASVRFGHVTRIKGATCLTDCTKIYCNSQPMIDGVRDGYGWIATHFHELQHVQQCKDVGGRKDYAKMWFKQFAGSALKAIFKKDPASFSDEVHDNMPMEKNAATKEVIQQEYERDFWHRAAHCRIVDGNSNDVLYVSEHAHPRVFCDPAFDRQGSRALKEMVHKVALKHGAGQYRLAFGAPWEKRPNGWDNGVWLGIVNVQNKALAALDFKVEAEGYSCPKKVTVHAAIIMEMPGTATYRIHYGAQATGWRTVKTEKAKIFTGEGNLARVTHVLPDELGPENDGNIRLEIKDSDVTAQKKLDITCPPLNATKLSLAFRDGEGSTCPRDVKTHLQIVANGPGLASVVIEPPLPGGVSNLLIGTKRVGDQYLGTYETTLKIKDDHKQAYRAQAKNGLSSPPATIDVSCLDVASGTLAVKQPQANSCKGEVALSLRSDVAGSVKYRLDCTGNRSWARTIQAHRTGPNTYLAVDRLALEAKNGEQVSCALKSLAGGQTKIVQLAGHKFECPRAGVSTPSAVTVPKTPAAQPKTKHGGRPAAATSEPPRAPSCIGGRIVSGRCTCARGQRPVRGACGK